MTWNLFKNQNTNTSEPSEGSLGTHTDGTIVEPPFFNVMPKKGVVLAPASYPVPASIAKPTTTVSKQQEKAVQNSTISKVSSSSEHDIFKAPPIVASDMSSGQGVSRKYVTIAIFVAVIALLCIGFSIFVFSSHSNFAGNVRRAVSALLGRTKDEPVVTAVVPTPAPKVYNTSLEWRMQYFGSADCADCEDKADADGDGLINQDEFTSGTDPKKPDTDGDGLADGDEVKVFACSPVDAHSAHNEKYSDADGLKGGWDCNKVDGVDALLSPGRVADITSKVTEFGLHEPTRTTLGNSISAFGAVPSSGAEVEIKLPAGTDTGPEASLERDIQRLNTIKKIAEGLLAYHAALKSYPPQVSFADMAVQIKPYNLVATNASDPVNVAPLIYGYELSSDGSGFALTYFSETQKQLIRYSDAQARQDVEEKDRQERDTQRMEDLNKIRSALLIYSATVANQNQTFVFPPKNQYQAKLAPQYIQVIPHDPQTQLDYPYEVSKDSSSFTLKTVLEEPAAGTSGYVCDQEGCKTY